MLCTSRASLEGSCGAATKYLVLGTARIECVTKEIRVLLPKNVHRVHTIHTKYNFLKYRTSDSQVGATLAPATLVHPQRDLLRDISVLFLVQLLLLHAPPHVLRKHKSIGGTNDFNTKSTKNTRIILHTHDTLTFETYTKDGQSHPTSFKPIGPILYFQPQTSES